MLFLAADTSGKHGSIALARGNPDGSCEIFEVVPLTGGTFSAQLVPQIAAVLAKHNRRKEDLGAFAVASGPGSFTGLRVGLSAIKALAEVMGRPVAVVSLLEAVAHSPGRSGRFTAALDAGRGEVYVGQYDLDQGKHFEERLLTPDQFFAEARDWIVVTPDQRVADAARSAGLEVELVEAPDSADIARLAWPRIMAGITVSPEELDANYLRRSDAEIFSKLASNRSAPDLPFRSK